MTTITQVELIAVLEPKVFERARRLALAIDLLKSGMRRRDATVIIRRRYGSSCPSMPTFTLI